MFPTRERSCPEISSFQPACGSSGGDSHFLNSAWWTPPRRTWVELVTARSHVSASSAGSPAFKLNPPTPLEGIQTNGVDKESARDHLSRNAFPGAESFPIANT